MALSLQKGGNLSLTKTDPNLVRVDVGLGWDARSTDGAAFDLDAVLFMVGSTGKVLGDNGFIFYRQLNSSCGSVAHQGDNLTGIGDGDDEVIKVDLSRVPQNIEKLVVCVSIYEADIRRQNFGQVSNAFIRVVNSDTQNEVTRYDLTEEASTNTAMIFGEIYRHGAEWKFRAVGQGYDGGLGPLARGFGVNIA